MVYEFAHRCQSQVTEISLAYMSQFFATSVLPWVWEADANVAQLQRICVRRIHEVVPCCAVIFTVPLPNVYTKDVE